MIFRFVALLALLSSGLAAVGNGWARLRAGMSPVETAATLGTPLIRSAGRGFELWIYDGRAEVVFFGGPVIAWTAPAGTPGTDASQSNFQFGPPTLPTYAPVPLRKDSAPRNAASPTGFDPFLNYRFKSR